MVIKVIYPCYTSFWVWALALALDKILLNLVDQSDFREIAMTFISHLPYKYTLCDTWYIDSRKKKMASGILFASAVLSPIEHWFLPFKGKEIQVAITSSGLAIREIMSNRNLLSTLVKKRFRPWSVPLGVANPANPPFISTTDVWKRE